MSTALDTEHPSAFELERLLADEWNEARSAEFRAHLSTCLPCAERLHVLEADHAAFRIEIPFGAFEARHQDAMNAATRTTGFSLRRWLSAATFAGLAVAAATFLLLPHAPTPSSTGIDHTRIKGGGAAIGYKLFDENGATRPGEEGEVLSAGDELILTIQAPSAYRYLAVLGIDGSGAVSRYYPGGSFSSAAMGSRAVFGSRPPSGQLPTSLVLDDSIGTERLFAIFSTTPTSLNVVRRAALQLVSSGADLEHVTRLPLPSEFIQDSTWFTKH